MAKKISAAKIFVFMMLLVIAVGSNAAQAWWWNKQTDFGTVNREALQQNLLEYKELATAIKQLDEEFSSYTQDTLAEQNKLSKELIKLYEREQTGKSQAKKEELLKEYHKKAEQLAEKTQKKLDTKQLEIEEKKQQAEIKTENQVSRLIEKVAMKEKVRYVVDAQYTYSEAKKDLTMAIIKESQKKK